LFLFSLSGLTCEISCDGLFRFDVQLSGRTTEVTNVSATVKFIKINTHCFVCHGSGHERAKSAQHNKIIAILLKNIDTNNVDQLLICFRCERNEIGFAVDPIEFQ
jgi:hypothetical protein